MHPLPALCYKRYNLGMLLTTLMTSAKSRPMIWFDALICSLLFVDLFFVDLLFVDLFICVVQAGVVFLDF